MITIKTVTINSMGIDWKWQTNKSLGVGLEEISKPKMIQSTLTLSPNDLTKESFVQIQ